MECEMENSEHRPQKLCDNPIVAIEDVASSDTRYHTSHLDKSLNSMSTNDEDTRVTNGHDEVFQAVNETECLVVNDAKMDGAAVSGDTSKNSDNVAVLNGQVTKRVTELEELVARTVKSLDGLTTHCAILQTTCSNLQVENRTLLENADLMKQEHDRINARLMSLLAVVAKLSATSAASRTPPAEMNNEANATTSQHTSDTMKTDASKAAVAVQAAATAQIELQLQTIKQQVTENNKSIKEFSKRADGVDGKIDWLETELQRYVRRHSLIIENFCPKEDRSASEIFLLFSNSVLNVPLDESDIDSLHLIDHTGQRQAAARTTKQGSAAASPEKSRLPRPILVTFTCYRARAQVYRAWLTFRSSSTNGGSASGVTGKAGTLSGERGQGLCVREFLTEAQDIVYRQATEAREKHLIADCWTFKGKTFMRTSTGDICEFVSTEQSVPKDDSRCSIM